MVYLLDKIFNFFYNKKRFYGFFYFLFLRGLRGIEHGRNYGEIETSGELRVLQLVKNHFDHPVIVDGGANVGEYTKRCAEIAGGTVYSFEPSTASFNLLQQNVKSITNAKLFRLALSDRSETLTLRTDQPNSVLASTVALNYSHYNISLNDLEEVQSTTIDQFCQDQGIAQINLLKLDIEGGEYLALRGAENMIDKGKIDLIQFEMGRPNVDAKTFFKDFYLLLHTRYRLYRIVSFGLLPIDNYSYEYEVFLGCNFLAVRNELKLI